MSLKSTLNQIIKERGSITLAELEELCHKLKYKLSNAERRLRPSDSPDIEPIYNEKRTAIIGYRFNRSDRENKGNKGWNGENGCCIWKGVNGIHASSCFLK